MEMSSSFRNRAKIVWLLLVLNVITFVMLMPVFIMILTFIAQLQDISNVLQDGGILSLVIPDKRFTFDYFRASTTAGELIESYLSRSTRPSTKQIFDFFA